MPVTLYALTTCPYCRMVKRFLDDGPADYELIEVDKLQGAAKDEVVAEVRRISGGASFPVIVIGDEVIVGFNKTRIKELLGL